MDTCPQALLAEIMNYLQPKELVTVFQKLSRACFQVSQESYFLGIYLRNLLCLPERIVPAPEMLKKLLRCATTGEAEGNLHWVGLATNGGVDRDSTYYWVDGAFKGQGGSGYSSREGKTNINIVGGLCDPENPSTEFTTARKVIADKYRGNHIVNYLQNQLPYNPNEDLSDRELMVFSQLWRQSAEMFYYDVPQEEREEKISEMNGHLTVILQHYPSLISLYRNPKDPMTLEDLPRRIQVEALQKFALVTKVKLSRQGDFSCPVQTLMVFSSFDYQDVDSEDLKLYDNLRSSEDVDQLIASNSAVPAASRLREHKGYFVRAFKPVRTPLRPLFWAKFKPNGKFFVERVKRGCCSRFLIVKLINCENRMQELHDLNPETNIDIAAVSAVGVLVPLD